MTKKKKRQFPTAYTVIVAVLVAVQILTFFIPTGNYATLSYNADNQKFEVVDPAGKTHEEAGTQKTLDKYKVKININKFKDGTIYKPVAIPNSYKRVKYKKPTIVGALKQFLQAQVQGVAESIDIITFILILGGIIGVIHANGAIDSGMRALSKKIKGRQVLLIIFVMGLIAIGGTTFGMAEETLAFYPILIPIFLMVGYDMVTVVATIFLGTSIGSLASTINPFSTVIASNTAGVNFAHALPLRIGMFIVSVGIAMIYTIRYAEKVRKNPQTSLISNRIAADKAEYVDEKAMSEGGPFTVRQKLTLIIFALGFIIMIWGVQQLGWYFTEIAMVFLGVSYILGFVSGLPEAKYVSSFISGAGELLGVALTVGLARAVSIVMEQSHTSDTIMNFFSKQVAGMNSLAFVWMMFVIFIILGFFIQSSSGLAVLSMPIMAPLANVIGVDRASVIDAYNWGQGFIGMVAPVGLILMSLAMVKVGFDKWMKFIWKLLLIEFGVCLLFLAIGLVFYKY